MAEPFDTPRFSPRVSMPARRWAGLLFLCVLPIAIFSGQLDSTTSTTVQGGAVRLELSYPARALAFEPHRLELVLYAQRDCEPLVGEIDPAFLHKVEEIQLLPTGSSAERVERPARRGESLRILLAFRPHQTGRMAGYVRARCGTDAPLEARFSTLVFP